MLAWGRRSFARSGRGGLPLEAGVIAGDSLGWNPAEQEVHRRDVLSTASCRGRGVVVCSGLNLSADKSFGVLLCHPWVLESTL